MSENSTEEKPVVEYFDRPRYASQQVGYVFLAAGIAFDSAWTVLALACLVVWGFLMRDRAMRLLPDRAVDAFFGVSSVLIPLILAADAATEEHDWIRIGFAIIMVPVMIGSVYQYVKAPRDGRQRA